MCVFKTGSLISFSYDRWNHWDRSWLPLRKVLAFIFSFFCLMMLCQPLPASSNVFPLFHSPFSFFYTEMCALHPAIVSQTDCRLILSGLICSTLGDAFLQYSAVGYFLPGMAAFGQLIISERSGPQILHYWRAKINALNCLINNIICTLKLKAFKKIVKI
jgi:hypothetical protein